MSLWHAVVLHAALAAPVPDTGSADAVEADGVAEEAAVASKAPPTPPVDGEADGASRSAGGSTAPRNAVDDVADDDVSDPTVSKDPRPLAETGRPSDLPAPAAPAVAAPPAPAPDVVLDLTPPPTSPRPVEDTAPRPAPTPTPPRVLATPTAVPRGPRSLVALVVASILAVLLSIWTVRARALLAPRGLLPDLLRVGHGVLRLFAALLLGLALAAVTPRSWLPWLGWGTLATLGVALFVVRDAVRDVVSGGVVAVEGRVRRGWLVRVGDEEGVVDDVTLRAAVLRGADGSRRVVPWRRFLEEDVSADESGRPTVTVTVHVPWDGDLDLVRERVAEAALVSPWRAPDSVPEVHRGEAAGAWEVRVRLLDPRFAASHRDTVRDLVARAFALDGGTRAPNG